MKRLLIASLVAFGVVAGAGTQAKANGGGGIGIGIGIGVNVKTWADFCNQGGFPQYQGYPWMGGMPYGPWGMGGYGGFGAPGFGGFGGPVIIDGSTLKAPKQAEEKKTDEKKKKKIEQSETQSD